MLTQPMALCVFSSVVKARVIISHTKPEQIGRKLKCEINLKC